MLVIPFLVACHSQTSGLLFVPGPDHESCLPSELGMSTNRSAPMSEVVAALPSALDLDWEATPEGASAPGTVLPSGTASISWVAEEGWRCEPASPVRDGVWENLVAVDVVSGVVTVGFPAREDVGYTGPFSLYAYDVDSPEPRIQRVETRWTAEVEEDLAEGSVVPTDYHGTCTDLDCVTSSLISMYADSLPDDQPASFVVGLSAELAPGELGIEEWDSGVWAFTADGAARVAGATDLREQWPFE